MGTDAKGKRQNAKCKRQNEESEFSAILTFAFCTFHSALKFLIQSWTQASFTYFPPPKRPG